MAEIGSNTSKANTAIFDENCESNAQPISASPDSSSAQQAIAQEDVFQMFLNRSPLLEEDGSQPKDNVSQEYQFMAMNINSTSKDENKPPSIDNSLESPFKVPQIPSHYRQRDEEDGQQQLRKRDLKALDRQQQAQYHKIVTEKQIVRVQDEVVLPENVHLVVKDKETLNIYEAWVVLPDQKHIKKLQKWLAKRKYTCHEHVTDDKLTLKAKLFNFTLYINTSHPQRQWWKETSPHSLLLDEVKTVQKERRELTKQVKLF